MTPATVTVTIVPSVEAFTATGVVMVAVAPPPVTVAAVAGLPGRVDGVVGVQ